MSSMCCSCRSVFALAPAFVFFCTYCFGKTGCTSMCANGYKKKIEKKNDIILREKIAELATVKGQFGKKYGAEFIRRAENDGDGCVNRNVIEKLSCDPPGGYVVTVSGK